MNNIKQFKSDFLKDNLLSVIQQGFDIILIWVAGSTLTGLSDTESDIDLGVLIANQTTITQTERNENYLIYKPTNTKVQWIYDTVQDITTLQSTANQRNIGWAQLRHLQTLEDDFILYVNPVYREFVKELIASKEIISEYSMWLYFNTKQALIQEILRQGRVIPECQQKSLYHLCWASDLLQRKTIDTTFLKAVKRIKTQPVSDIYLKRIYEKICWLADYFTKEIPNKPILELRRNE